MYTDIYRRMNNDKDNDRWSRWTKHREAIELYWDKDIFSVEPNIEKILIVGAGNLHDINMGKLLSYESINEIHLLDCDTEVIF